MAKKAKGRKRARRAGMTCQIDGGCPNPADGGRVQTLPLAWGLGGVPRIVCQAHKRELDEARKFWV